LSSDFTATEARIAVALGDLKQLAGSRLALACLLMSGLSQTAGWRAELERMRLDRAGGLAERINRRLLCASLAKTDDGRPLFSTSRQ
jgi:hypothetical protein